MRKHGAAVERRATLLNFKRRSIMGTKGYMAPEMARLLNQVCLCRFGAASIAAVCRAVVGAVMP